MPPESNESAARPSLRVPELTDLGNAERFALQHRKHARYCHQFACWMVFDGRRWIRDVTGQAQRYGFATVRSWHSVLEAYSAFDGWEELVKAVTKHAKSSQSARAINAMLELAKSLPDMTVDQEQLDDNPWLLNCLTGTIDLKTGIERQHDPKDLITKLAPVRFDSKAKHQTWSNFVAHVTGGDDEFRKFLQRAAGYFLTGVNSEKCFFLAHSIVPNTGKSTFLDALTATMGDYATGSAAETWLKQRNPQANRGDLARLKGARLVVASEFDEDARFDESLIKGLTGGDSITVSDKYEKAFTYRPQFKLLLAANHAPRFSGNDEAMVVRTRRMPFIHVAKTLDKSLKLTLSNPDIVGAAILNWAVRGCLDWQKNGLPTPDAVRRSNESYQKENDESRWFFDERLEYGRGSAFIMSRRDMRELYEKWCRDEGIKHPFGPAKIAKRLRGHEVEEVMRQGERYWVGVKPKSTLARTLPFHDEAN